MSFSKYDLSPLGIRVYRQNSRFLLNSYKVGTRSFEDYFENLHPRILDEVVRDADELWSECVLEIEEDVAANIANSIIEAFPEKPGSGWVEIFDSKKHFKNAYKSLEWKPGFDITDSFSIEHYKLESPYNDEIEKLRRKSALYKGRELPTFLGFAGGVPAAVATDSTVLAGGGSTFLAAYLVSKNLSLRYNARAEGMEKKIEDTIYEELALNRFEEFKDYDVRIA